MPTVFSSAELEDQSQRGVSMVHVVSFFLGQLFPLVHLLWLMVTVLQVEQSLPTRWSL